VIEDILNATAHAILFGLIGLIAGIWSANLIYILFLKNMDNVTTTHISLIVILLMIVSGGIIGFIKGKDLLNA